MAQRISGVFHCNCGKLHTISGVGTTSECSCGQRLYRQMLYAVQNILSGTVPPDRDD